MDTKDNSKTSSKSSSIILMTEEQLTSIMYAVVRDCLADITVSANKEEDYLNSDEFVKTAETLELLHCSPATLWRRVQECKIHQYGTRRNSRFKKSEILNYLENLKINGTEKI